MLSPEELKRLREEADADLSDHKWGYTVGPNTVLALLDELERLRAVVADEVVPPWAHNLIEQMSTLKADNAGLRGDIEEHRSLLRELEDAGDCDAGPCCPECCGLVSDLGMMHEPECKLARLMKDKP